MATLGYEFEYEGNATDLPFSYVDLELAVTPYFYRPLVSGEGSVPPVERQVGNSQTIKAQQKLLNDIYQISIPIDYLFTPDDQSIINLWKALKNIYDYSSDRWFFAKTEDLFFDFLLDVKEKGNHLNDQRAINALILFIFANEEYASLHNQFNQEHENEVIYGTTLSKIKRYLIENNTLINKKEFDKLTNELQLLLGSVNHLPIDLEQLAYALISFVTILEKKKPVFRTNFHIEELLAYLLRFNIRDGHINENFTQSIFDLLKNSFTSLFNFPIILPAITIIKPRGKIEFISPDNHKASQLDMLNYDLFLERHFFESSELDLLVKYTWSNFTDNLLENNTINFDFFTNNDLYVLPTASNIKLSLRLADNTLLQSQSFNDHDKEDLENIKFKVPLYKTQTNNPLPSSLHASQQLRGKVIELSGQCDLNALTVVLQAKEQASDQDYKVIGSALTDKAGNFMMPYPLGVFHEARAIVSLATEDPVNVAVHTDTAHINTRQTIANDFLFLLLKNLDCSLITDKTHNKQIKRKTPRLPEQEDLINSDDFSQDLGAGSCVNLTTPNRTLSELSYYAVVRTSEPDVAHYTLQKSTGLDNADPLNFAKNKTIFTLSDGKRIERKPVDLANPIRWQDAPESHTNVSLYQAVQVAHGHLLQYKTVWKADGYSLGDLIYSLPLAPGQKKQIVINELKRTLQGSQEQKLIQREQLTASMVNDRSIINNLTGNINEALKGTSKAKTGSISASGGFPLFGGFLGVSGGYSQASSEANQISSRSTAQSFDEVLKNSIEQSAGSYRELNGTIIETVSESQQFNTTTEVVANHNHCHSLTILYFEVLRHYAIYQELNHVDECLFVPLLMTNFTAENIYKWKDILASNLLPRPSNTYLPTYFGADPLVTAFDALGRLKTNYQFVDFPQSAYNEETIINITGGLTLRVNLPRPKTRYDRIFTLPIVEKTITYEGFLGLVIKRTWKELQDPSTKDDYISIDANFQRVSPANSIRVAKFDTEFFENEDSGSKSAWEIIARLANENNEAMVDPIDFLQHYFEGRLISEWDKVFYSQIAPKVVKKIGKLIELSFSPFKLDLTQINNYTIGEQIISFSITGSTSRTRKSLDNETWKFEQLPELDNLVSAHFSISSFNLRYSTQHYEGNLFNAAVNNDLSDGVEGKFPYSSLKEKRNPRKDDIFVVNELIEHLNSNLEYYNKILWHNLDPDRRYLLLDGFSTEVYNDLLGGIVNKSLASVVKNELIGIAGNSLIFPVAAGIRLDRNNIILSRTEESTTQVNLDLFDHYKPLTPMPPYRISVPTHGVYAEAIQGACDACEKIKDNTSQDWDKFKPDEPTIINPVTVGTPIASSLNPQLKDFATPIVNIQNAPTVPDPGAGLANLSVLLGKPDVFRDVTGLSENQKNALQAFSTTQQNAKEMAQLAKDMAMQKHNTEHADKIADAIRNSPELSEADKKDLLKKHFNKVIGDTSAENENKPAQTSLKQVAAESARQGRDVKASSTDAAGNSETLEVGASKNQENILAEVEGDILQLKQVSNNVCWATAATIMMSWKAGKTLKVEDMLRQAGEKYTKKYNQNETLKSSEKPEFIEKLEMVDEDKANNLQDYINWIKTYGPLWITTDANDDDGSFSPHARILIKITGTGAANGIGTFFTFIDPATGGSETQPYNDYTKGYEQMIRDNPSSDSFIQVVHFKDNISVGEGARFDPWGGFKGRLTFNENIGQQANGRVLIINFGTYYETNRFKKSAFDGGFLDTDVMFNADPQAIISKKGVIIKKVNPSVFPVFSFSNLSSSIWTEGYRKNFKKWMDLALSDNIDCLYLTGHAWSHDDEESFVVSSGEEGDSFMFAGNKTDSVFTIGHGNLTVKFPIDKIKSSCKIIFGFGCSVGTSHTTKLYQDVFGRNNTDAPIVCGWNGSTTVNEWNEPSVIERFFDFLEKLANNDNSIPNLGRLDWFYKNRPIELVRAWGYATFIKEPILARARGKDGKLYRMAYNQTTNIVDVQETSS